MAGSMNVSGDCSTGPYAELYWGHYPSSCLILELAGNISFTTAGVSLSLIWYDGSRGSINLRYPRGRMEMGLYKLKHLLKDIPK